MMVLGKFMSIFLPLLVFFSSISNSLQSQTTLNCIFHVVGWDTILLSPYACEVKSLDVTSRVMITHIEGQHKYLNLAHANVSAVQIRDQICEFFPRGIDKFFTNLEGIAVQRSRLRIVTKNDLKPFTKLRSLSLFGNQLKSLEYGLLKFNPQLEFISFFNNSLEHVAEDLLDDLKFKKIAYFTNCNCINDSADTPQYFEIIKLKLMANCSTTLEMRNFYELELQNERTEKNFDVLVKKFKQKSNEARILNHELQRLQNLSNTSKSSCNANEEVSLKLEYCEEKLKTFHLEIDQVELICDFYNGKLCIVEDIMILNDHTQIVGVKSDINAMKNQNLVQVSSNNNRNSSEYWVELKKKQEIGKITVNLVQKDPKVVATEVKVTIVDNQTATPEIQKVTDKFGNLYLTNSEKVEELFIVSHNLHFLPINIGEFFPNLKDLRVMKSKMTKITANSLKNLEKLEVLMMPKNEIVEIEEKAFSQLPNLKLLDLSDNQIESLCKNAKIENLNLKSHEIYDQNHQFYPVENDYDEIESEVVTIPPQNQHEICRNFKIFAPLENLKEINLENNKISYINWKVFENNENLEVINLKNNRISEIGSNFNLYALKHLDLSGNTCVDAQYSQLNANAMMETFVNNCKVGIMLKCLFENHHGDYTCRATDFNIDSENTIFTHISGMHQTELMTNSDVTKLIIIEQNSKFFPNLIQGILPNVTKLEIVSSKLTKVPKLKGFKTIDITSNDIPTIDDKVFNDSPEIEAIDLSDNKIFTIPDNLFGELKYLKYLNISNNQLATISTNFIPVENSIQEFFLKNNKLMKIDSNIVKNLVNADIIEFSGNLCVDNKFYRAADNVKKIMEIYGEIEFKCK
ncbi:hypothetical protein PVAND_016805 [Polypedilum vanderplanki]|uniref:Uncharacterized protein n=1 Tax=Polypedilum vanderplanki TaxID=319348 RepID=A0A9J6BGH1_POLVA|nr:hypothetical protein PVAND_016805 [Polypedilum vanderplanki]